MPTPRANTIAKSAVFISQDLLRDAWEDPSTECTVRQFFYNTMNLVPLTSVSRVSAANR
jgi:hypothetical protein